MQKDSERTRLLNDYSVIGEGVPMMSASQQPLTVDDVVYSGSVSVTDNYDARPMTLEMETLSWRVIQVNYQDRYVRLRNAEGCETTLSFSEGCTRMKVYHDFDVLRGKLLELLEKEQMAASKAVSIRQNLLERVTAGMKQMEKMKAPPAPVLTEKVVKKGKPN